VLAWLIVVPIVEVIALGYRSIVRLAIIRRFRGEPLLAGTPPPSEGPAQPK
jgi:hypothetical protein